jgi:GNAT superfamily N-acetyltransferase
MAMKIDIREEKRTALADYGSVPIAFEVKSILKLEVVDGGLGGFLWTEHAIERPWTKDYDVDSGEGPTRWAKRFNIDNWGILSAFDGEKRIGGCVLAYDTKGLSTLEDRADLAALWDLRVDSAYRRRGVGASLFDAAVAWAAARNCAWLKIETQNINVTACRFYAKQGCELGIIHRFAYKDFPEEAELVWYRKML